MARSCQAFDAGYEGEARRLAVAVRILVHDTARSTLLLVQLRQKAGMMFWDTSTPIEPRNIVPEFPLLVMRVGSEKGTRNIDWLPLCLVAPPEPPSSAAVPVSFPRWWDGVVLKAVAGAEAKAKIDPSPDDPSKQAVCVSFSVKVKSGHVVRGEETLFTRRQMVLALANQDGGAHVDPILDDAY
jgi:hypothetical protein